MSAGNSQGDISIAVSAAGTQETEEEIASVENRLESAGETMDDTAGDMSGLQRKMSGLGRTLVASLAVAAAGLLSQVPVLGELFAGLGAIVQSLAFQMDQVLRPALTPITNILFQISEAIFEAEGAWGAFIGIVATIATVLGGAIGAFLALGGSLSTVAGVATTIAVVLGKVIVGALAAVAGAISLPVLAIAALVAAIILVVEHFIGWGNIADFVIAKLGDLVDWLKTLPSRISGVVAGIREWVGNVVAAVGDLVTDVTDTVTGMVDDALGWGMDLVAAIADGIRSAVGAVTDAVGDVTDAVVSNLPGFVQAELGVSATGTAAGGGGVGGGGTAGGGFGADRSGGRPVISMDGRRLTRTDSRFRRDGTARRNRNA